MELPSSAAAYSAFVCLMAEEDLLADEEGDPEALGMEEQKVYSRGHLRRWVILLDAGAIWKCSPELHPALRSERNSRLLR